MSEPDRAPARSEPDRILAAAGLPSDGPWARKSGWVSRAWIGDRVVVRVGGAQAADAYRHEAAVVPLLPPDVPHAPYLGSGDGPDGAWYVSGRLPGQSLHDAWPSASVGQRRALVHDLGTALRALHRVPAPAGLRPPWLADALDGPHDVWPAYHPPVVAVAPTLVDDARRVPGHDARLLDAVGRWIGERLPLFADDELVLVHGDLHGSNLVVEDDRVSGPAVSGLIDFAETIAAPADVELDTILRWCARPSEFPPTPDAHGLDPATLAAVPEWLREAYPELFARADLRARLEFCDMWVELAIAAHHPESAVRDLAAGRMTGLLEGRSHLDAFPVLERDRR